MADFRNAEVGATLPEVQFGPVTRTTLALYAGASGDHNPIHIDLDFAKKAGLDDVFAHGMLFGDTGWGVTVHNIVVHYVATCGTDEQKRRWLPRLASGEWVGAIAMTEPGTGSDLQAVRTMARADGNEYVLTGSKTFITNGQTADFVIVVAKTDPAMGAKGISLIGLETAAAEGFRRGRNLKKLGMRSQDTSELFFEDVRLPRMSLLGPEEGQGFFQLMKQLPWERLTIALRDRGRSVCPRRHTRHYIPNYILGCTSRVMPKGKGQAACCRNTHPFSTEAGRAITMKLDQSDRTAKSDMS